MKKKRATINWDKSFMLTAEQVGLLGLEDKSVSELGKPAEDVPDLARLADAMEALTTSDLTRWYNERWPRD